jgi:diguanylate cyclase (GGDEF)-like protein
MTTITTESQVPEPEQVTDLLRAAREIGIAIRNTRDEVPLLTDTLERLARVMRMQNGAILMHDGRQLQVATVDEVVHPPEGMPAIIDFIERAIETTGTSEVTVMTDLSTQMPLARRVDDQAQLASVPLQTLVMVPLATHGAPMGVIVISDQESREFHPAELDTLYLIGQLLAGGLSERRLQVKFNTVSRQIAEQHERVCEPGDLDPLTKLVNQNFFATEMERTVVDTIPTGGQLSLLVLDVDHLQSINDTYGKAFGDEVLVRIAETIQASIRGRDLAARCSGEEFCVLLPATPGLGAVVVGERLRERVSSLTFSSPRGPFHPTVSIGVSCLSTRVTTTENLVAKANYCRAQAKELGGNQIIFDWDEALESVEA